MSGIPRFDGLRLVFYHKQSTSGRLRFLRFAHGIFGFEPVDAWFELEDDASSEACAREARTDWHPALLARAAEGHFSLPAGEVEVDTEFDCVYPTSQGLLRIRALAFTRIDPPFAPVEACGARFFAITESLDLPLIERDILRRVYEHVLG
ncbi:MAG: hypothetical protein RBR73_07100 [Halothiobacillaceae bacterium]|jgi:hypothetical protein|nr:hypothetical protein [Halothiobacillaceae bacterium]